MKRTRQNVLVFLAALGATLAGVLPSAGCTGGCATCFRCAGLGGVAIALTVLRSAGGTKPADGVRTD